MNVGIYIGSTGVPVRLLTPKLADIAASLGFDPAEINSLHAPLGAASHSQGDFLIDFNGLSKLRSSSSYGSSPKAQTVTFQSADQNGPQKAVTFPMYLDRVQPILQGTEGTGLFLAHMVDGRKYAAADMFTGATKNGYGVTTIGSRGTYIGGSSATLNTLLSAAFQAWSFGSEVTGSINSSYLAIDWAANGSYANEPAAVVIDRVCRIAGWACNQTGTIQDFNNQTLSKLANSSPLNMSFSPSSGGYASAVIGGGPSFLTANPIGGQVPGSINVLFPLAGLNGAPNPSNNSLESYSFYSVNVPATVSPSNSKYTEIVYDNFWVQGTNGNIPSAQKTAAQSRAAIIAAAFYRRFQMPLGRWRLKGWYFDPNWMAHVALSIQNGIPITDVWLDAEDVSWVKCGRARGIYANGGITVSQSPDGMTRISGIGGGVFPVLVKQNGGAAGTSTTTITATYNVYSVSDTGLINPLNGGTSPTPLSPLMNRSLISPANVTVGVAASGSVGTACYNGSGAIQLLWVQETPSWGC